MTRPLYSFQYGEREIRYDIVRRPRRTLEITVAPDSSVVVAAPQDVIHSAIEAKLRKRARWILGQQRYFSQFLPRTVERRYVSGETHLYLGRQYRLKVIQGAEEGVKLIHGYILVHTERAKDQAVVRDLVNGWYRQRALIKFPERIEHCLGLFANAERFQPERLTVRVMTRRWGSMSPAGHLLLNSRLVQAPVHAIDYVIAHELCHRAHPHHGPAFYALLDGVMPDWRLRKLRLERSMV